MLVPDYWAEARRQHRTRERQVTVRRFGWSDRDRADAQAMADRRADEALARILRGEELESRESRVGYSGSAGVPIREEVLARHGDHVVTRNVYGARCLNTPDVLFADVDFGGEPGCRPTILAFLLLTGLAWGVAGFLGSPTVGIVLNVAALVVAGPLVARVAALVRRLRGGDLEIALRRILAFSGEHPEWGIRVYVTPNGLRLLATHRTFAPDDPAVTSFFAAVGTDPRYAAMCRVQRCFRARLTAKPWRIGIQEHLRGGSRNWPVAPGELPARDAWVARYEPLAAGYAACRFLTTAGPASVARAVAPVVELHDRLSGALEPDRPLA